MAWFKQISYLGEDLKRWKCASIKDLFYMIFEQAVWVTIFYRIGRMLFLIDIPILKIFFRLIGFFLMKFSELFLGAAIKPGADIGPGFFLSHTGIVRVHPQTKAGKNLSITVGVILGEKGLGGKGAPILGDNVFIGAGAKVLGTLRIGNNAKIGANAVVTHDIPDDAIAVGVPARILPPKNGEKQP
jgi:serine O-acetyltransferase